MLYCNHLCIYILGYQAHANWLHILFFFVSPSSNTMTDTEEI